MALWNLPSRPELGLIGRISEMLRREGEKGPSRLPVLSSEWLLVASDYSGQHASAPYEGYSILLGDFGQCSSWYAARSRVRSSLLSDGRRLAYKNLRDRRQEMALIPFLNAADDIPGVLLTVLVDRQIDNLFRFDEEDLTEPNIGPLARWPRTTLEKMLRVVHLISLLLAGLSKPGQNVVWITDQDEIAANETRLNELLIAFRNVASNYLSHGLGHLRIGTTDVDDGSRDIEDLASVADLAAGAAVDSLGRHHGQVGWPPPLKIIVPSAAGTPGKASIGSCQRH